MSDGSSVDRKDVVDPDIRRFVGEITASYAAHATKEDASMTARRAVAERVRRPWREGGPVMAQTTDMELNGLRLRLHRPIDGRTLPAMFYIHGGGWTLFSVDTHDRLMREYAARAGVVVLGIDYSLSPEHRFPTALEECIAALEWMRAEASELEIDPDHILIGGDSAGGNLAVTVCLSLREQGRPLPAGMLLNYGAFSPEHLPSYERFGSSDYSLEPDEMDLFWQNYVGDPSLLSDPLVVPLRADLAGLPPAFLAVAECDILADCNHAFAARLAEAGVPARTVVYPGATHSFLEAVSISSLANRALDDEARWMREITGAPADHAVAL